MHSPLPLHVVILAAGIGSRMRSVTPKVLHCLAGKPLLTWVIQAAQTLHPDAIHIIYGHEGEQLQAHFKGEALHWVHQAEQRGTAHALEQALPNIPDEALVLVLAGDVPLIQSSTLKKLLTEGAMSHERPGLGLLLAEPASPFGYGRVIRNAQHHVVDIVEEKDASTEQRTIREIYTGTCVATAAIFKKLLPLVQPHNAQKEYYLTQVVSLAVQHHLLIHTLTVDDEVETQGVNTRLQLATLERHWQRQQAHLLLEQGISIADPARIDIRGTLQAEPDVFIDVNAVFEGVVILKRGCKIGPNCVLKDVSVGEYATIFSHSVIDSALIGAHANIGPFARLRPGTRLEAHAKIGNFVETKNAHFGEASKANHLSYLGDVEIGQHVNIGAGTITCNYDGVNKHQTHIDNGAFIGSGTQLIAPVRVGENATIGAGTTLRSDAPAEALTLTVREQKTIHAWVRPQKKNPK